jgi:hypothetical protein
LALGNSIITKSAVDHFGELIGADEIQNLTHSSFNIDTVTVSISTIDKQPDVVTLTLGGDDLLQCRSWNEKKYSLLDQDTKDKLNHLRVLFMRLYDLHCKVIVNTIYAPTQEQKEVSSDIPGTPVKCRADYNGVNNTIRRIAGRYGFLIAEIQELFTIHGLNSQDTWLKMEKEPNESGATAIADCWYKLFLTPERGMILRDIHDGWSFSLGINDYEFEYDENKGKSDNQWLVASLCIVSYDASWHWIDPTLMFHEAKKLSKWFSDIAVGNSFPDDISFLEPEIAFEVVRRDSDSITVRVNIYNPDAPYSRRNKHEFRQIWTQAKRPISKPVNPEFMVSVVYKDFTVTYQDVREASESLLNNLRQLTPRKGLAVDDIS